MMKRSTAIYVCFLLACAMLGFFLAPTQAGLFGRTKPTATLTASAAEITAGEPVTLTWSSTNGAATLDGEPVEASGTAATSPTETTTYTLICQGTRRRAATDTVTVTVQGDPVPPTPPVPPVPPSPPGDSGLSAIGIGSAFSLSQSLSLASTDHELRVFIESQQGTWAVIDPLMLNAPHPAALDAWAKLLGASGKKQPAVIWYAAKGGKLTILGIDECGPETTGAVLLAKARSYVPAPTDKLVIAGKTRSLGLKPAKRGAAIEAPRVSEILQPLAADKYPVGVDLRGQFNRNLDQGSYGSCVSQSMAACYEAAVFRSFGARNKTDFSPNFLATAGNGWDGAYGADIAGVLMETGIVSLKDQPDYSHKLPADWKTLAGQNKALGVYGPPDKNPRGHVAASLARGLPVSVAIAVGNGFEPDSEGYITWARGGGNQVNHQVIAAGGYFVHGGKKFWLMKNSWGASWGTLGDGCAYLEDRFLDDDTDMWVIVVPSANPAYTFAGPTSIAATPGKVVSTRVPAKPPVRAWVWTAAWCGSCPAVHRVAKQLAAEGWDIEFVDFDSADSAGCEITAVPTIQIGRGEVEVVRRVGAQSIESMRAWFRAAGVRKTEKPR